MILKPMFFCDIDNTIHDQYASIKTCYEIYSQNECDYYRALNEPDGYLWNGKPIEGALEAIMHISKEYEIIYISARPRSMLKQTQDWLQHYGFYVDCNDIALVNKMEDKMLVLLRHTNCVFVDDAMTGYSKLNPQINEKFTDMISSQHGIKFIRFDKNWDYIVDECVYNKNNKIPYFIKKKTQLHLIRKRLLDQTRPRWNYKGQIDKRRKIFFN